MRKPDMCNKHGEPCLPVVKHGNTTGTTLGHANGIMSIIHKYGTGSTVGVATSMEWCIINAGKQSPVFSAGGDSGSAIVDIRGQMGGKLSGGGGATVATDVTYATPFWWELGRIKSYLHHANLDVV
ncbi:hypothetical protein ACGC1H_005496 [Rhizoctonia solani]